MNNDLQNALEQLKLGVNKRYGTTILLPGGAQALLDERDALRGACKAAMELIPLIEQGMGSAHPERRQREQLIRAALKEER